jgi:hypothetical protein
VIENSEQSIITSSTQELREAAEKFVKDSAALIEQFNNDMAALRLSVMSKVAAIMDGEPELDRLGS